VATSGIFASASLFLPLVNVVATVFFQVSSNVANQGNVHEKRHSNGNEGQNKNSGRQGNDDNQDFFGGKVAKFVETEARVLVIKIQGDEIDGVTRGFCEKESFPI
jgi:hypothetical protein